MHSFKRPSDSGLHGRGPVDGIGDGIRCSAKQIPEPVDLVGIERAGEADERQSEAHPPRRVGHGSGHVVEPVELGVGKIDELVVLIRQRGDELGALGRRQPASSKLGDEGASEALAYGVSSPIA